MTFWLVAFLMAAAVTALVLLALRRGGAEQRAAEADMQVYKDQLKEVDRDLARGVITETEAETVRVEVSRRLLEADRAVKAGGSDGAAPRSATIVAAALMVAVVLGGAFGLYRMLGAPGYPDLPLAARIAAAENARVNRPDQATAEAEVGALPRLPVDADPRYLELMDKLRATVAERPDDLEGHRLLVRNEVALGNFSAARDAQERVLAILGDDATATDFSDYADVLVMAAGGYVSPEAEAALTQALRRDPANKAARYYSGLLMIQTGRPDIGFRLWRALLEQSAPTDPWVAPIRAQLPELAQIAGVRNFQMPPMPAGTAVPGRGPTAEQMEAAAEMTAEDRAEMIRGMVEGLSDRLATQGGPPEDWARLIGALGVLGETDQARAIADEAEQVFAGNDTALSMIADARARAGIN